MLTLSLVLYQNNPSHLSELLKSITHIETPWSLYIFDNSPTTSLQKIFPDQNNIYYFHNAANLGFSKGHNQILKFQSRLPSSSKYHLIINPDIYFEKGTVEELIDYLENSPDVGLISPKILYPTGEIQYLCKQNPTLISLFGRRFLPFLFKYSPFRLYMDWYEMRNSGYNSIIDVKYMTGCFMLFRWDIFLKIHGFDENIFMYLEDADITRRAAHHSRCIFYPYVSVYHHWARGSHKSWKLTWINIQSAIYYFSKYGWKII